MDSPLRRLTAVKHDLRQLAKALFRVGNDAVAEELESCVAELDAISNELYEYELRGRKEAPAAARANTGALLAAVLAGAVVAPTRGDGE